MLDSSAEKMQPTRVAMKERLAPVRGRRIGPVNGVRVPAASSRLLRLKPGTQQPEQPAVPAHPYSEINVSARRCIN
jgi:hypothetical protein